MSIPNAIEGTITMCMRRVLRFFRFVMAVYAGCGFFAEAMDLPPPMKSGSKANLGSVHPFFLHHPSLQGKIVGNRYYGYEDAFSMELPTSLESGQIEDFYLGSHTGGVAFYNDYGFFLKVEIDEVIPEVESLITRHADIKGEILDAIFSDVILRQMKESVPALQIIDKKETKLPDGDPALFVVVNYPEASSMIDPLSGRAFDSKRGYLLFFAKDKAMISLSLQDTLSFIPSVAEAAKLSLSDRLLNHLRRYQGTFRLEEAPTNKRGGLDHMDTKRPAQGL